MAYDLSSAMFVENGPTQEARAAAARRSPAGATTRHWVALSRERRLAMVDLALKAA